MKTLFSLLITVTMAMPVLGQGKVNFVNNSLHLVYVDPNLVGGTNAGQAYVLGMGGQTLTIELWAGTSSTSLALVSTTDFSGQTSPGTWVRRLVIMGTIPPGPAFFQILIYDAAAGSYLMASTIPGHYFGQSPIFTCTASGTVAYWSLVNHNSPANSTWADGTYNLDSLSPGSRGAIMLGGAGGVCGCEYDVYIDLQPGNQTVVRGGTATFAVAAHVGCNCVPLNYQWLFNGIAIPRATNNTYQITNVQPANAGIYSVAVCDFLTGVQSSGATLTVLPLPPAIISPPQTQTAELGATVDFRLGATGDPPLVYQWLFNGTYGVNGVSTNAALQLSNVQFAQAGAYTVVVSNLTAAVTSSPALLNVIAPVERKLVPALTLMGQSGDWLNLDYALALAPAPNWTGLDTVALTNAPQWYFDAAAPLTSERFYRAWGTNVLSPPSALDLHMVPAITLTGAIGSSVHVDYINQFGPIDAWVTLDTVTLTSSPQLFFDTSSIGQPARVYRIVQLP